MKATASRRKKNQIEANRRILEFLDKYLKDEEMTAGEASA